MKKFLWIMLLTLILNLGVIFSSIASAEEYDARLRLLANSVDDVLYEIYIIGSNEQLLDSDWIWREHDKYNEIYKGDYYAFITPATESNLKKQNVHLFGDLGGATSEGRINVLNNTRDGVYVVQGKAGQPDLIVSKIQQSGGGQFESRIFVIKDGSLQLLKLMDKDRRFTENTYTGFKNINYLDDGTIAIHWWTNDAMTAGKYTTVYMLDIKNLVLIGAYTVRR